MPEMSEENYQAILSSIEEIRTENDKIKKSLADMVAMNKALLNSRASHQSNSQDTQAYKKELDAKLKKEYDKR